MIALGPSRLFRASGKACLFLLPLLLALLLFVCCPLYTIFEHRGCAKQHPRQAHVTAAVRHDVSSIAFIRECHTFLFSRLMRRSCVWSASPARSVALPRACPACYNFYAVTLYVTSVQACRRLARTKSKTTKKARGPFTLGGFHLS